MFPALRRHWTLWAVWVLAASLCFASNPWFEPGWTEWVASLSSLGLLVDHRLRRELLLMLGLPALALLCVSEAESLIPLRLAMAWLAFAGSVFLAARAVDDLRELEGIAGGLAADPRGLPTLDDLERELEREIGRARRHERAFVVLSIVPHPRNHAGASSETASLLPLLELRRSLHRLRELIASEVHVYAEVTVDGDRVLALVPEVESAAIGALVERLTTSALDEVGLEIAVGVGAFPDDAVCASELIAVADADRRALKLEAVHVPQGEHSTSPAVQARDAQG